MKPLAIGLHAVSEHCEADPLMQLQLEIKLRHARPTLTVDCKMKADVAVQKGFALLAQLHSKVATKAMEP